MKKSGCTILKLQTTRYQYLIIFLLSLLIIMGLTLCALAKPQFTEEELDYIAQSDVIKAASLDGSAPHHYTDSYGNARGIAIEVLKEISAISGLDIEYELHDSSSQITSNNPHLVFGVTEDFVSPTTTLTIPYLRSETILFVNSSVEPQELENKRYAHVRGKGLPDDIREENTIYFDSREESLTAVNKGNADFGYANPYSIAFYTLQNNYRNLISIPHGREKRDYAIGVIQEDPILLSILNKTIASIDDKKMQNLILYMASNIEHKLSVQSIFDAYGSQIITITLLTLTILLVLVIKNNQINRNLKLQNRRYEMLSQISNEFLFEYSIVEDLLILSDKFKRIIGLENYSGKEVNKLHDALRKLDDKNNQMFMIKITTPSGVPKVFKVHYSRIEDRRGHAISLIGKLVDVSKDVKEKEELLTRAQLDGLTNLYNATTAQTLITKRILTKKPETTDVLMLIDCDKFKDINDTYGHLKGNQALENISASLRQTFRNTDIIGRMGGDEFSAYIHDIPSLEFILSKTEELRNSITLANPDFELTISVGIALIRNEKSFESAFHKADHALYSAKNSGVGKTVIYNEDEGTNPIRTNDSDPAVNLPQ